MWSGRQRLSMRAGGFRYCLCFRGRVGDLVLPEGEFTDGLFEATQDLPARFRTITFRERIASKNLN
jgi:hypothetical protein